MGIIRLGDIAPNFVAKTTQGEINFHNWLGDYWGIIFSHPADFTPVCTTELGIVAKNKSEFDKRNVKCIALSVDKLETHEKWVRDINDTQDTVVNFPIIADEDKRISELYNMIHPNAITNLTVRTVYVIDNHKRVQMLCTYSASTGRNFDELLRVVDSLQLTAYHKVATPGNWKNGDDCFILPNIPKDQYPELFPKGYKEIKPYLIKTPQPNLF